MNKVMKISKQWQGFKMRQKFQKVSVTVEEPKVWEYDKGWHYQLLITETTLEGPNIQEEIEGLNKAIESNCLQAKNHQIECVIVEMGTAYEALKARMEVFKRFIHQSGL